MSRAAGESSPVRDGRRTRVAARGHSSLAVTRSPRGWQAARPEPILARRGRVAYLCSMQNQRGPLALAFSGGLDTSYCVPRLTEQGWAVHTVFVNTGGATAAERDAIRTQAAAVGAVQHHEIDARAEVFDRFVRYLIQGNVLRGEVYPLSVSAERTQQAISVVELARAIGAHAVGHGSTGAGNDQI